MEVASGEFIRENGMIVAGLGLIGLLAVLFLLGAFFDRGDKD